MSEKELSIKQVEEIMEWSYPTALKFAKQHGTMAGDNKWFISSDIVAAEIMKELDRVNAMKERLANIIVWQ